MLRNSRLGTQFTLFLVLIFVFGSAMAGLILSRLVESMAETTIRTQGLLLLQTMNSVRSYTSEHVGPTIRQIQASQAQFVPEAVPNFSASRVFKYLREQPGYQGFIYKEAAPNPINPSDLTDDFEVRLVNDFRKKPSMAQAAGFAQRGGQQVYYIAQPLIVTRDSCLGCHGSSAKAPAGLVNMYGTVNGFEWQKDQVVAAQVVYVPANLVYEYTQRTWLAVMGVLAGIFGVAALTINLLLRGNVIRPVERMAVVAGRIAAADVQESEPASLASLARRPDELGQLAQVFQTMTREVYAREQRLRQKVQELRIEIDEARKAREVAEITETDYFQALQRKARDLRRRTSPAGSSLPLPEGESEAAGSP